MLRIKTVKSISENNIWSDLGEVYSWGTVWVQWFELPTPFKRGIIVAVLNKCLG